MGFKYGGKPVNVIEEDKEATKRRKGKRKRRRKPSRPKHHPATADQKRYHRSRRRARWNYERSLLPPEGFENPVIIRKVENE